MARIPAVYGAIRVGDTSTGINFGGTITLLGNSSVGSPNASASSLTFNISGPIVGSGSLTKLQTTAAPITCTLGGTNTYTGNTIVSWRHAGRGSGGRWFDQQLPQHFRRHRRKAAVECRGFAGQHGQYLPRRRRVF